MKKRMKMVFFLAFICALLTPSLSRASSSWQKFVADAKPPASAAIERNGRAFLFVLEFALGAPFTDGQEKTILAELGKGWETKPEQDLRKYDSYPKIVEVIIKAMDRKSLEDLRQELEKTIREWLGESNQSDPAVAVISAQLKQKGKVLVPGNPPLTVMAATAYGEMVAYSELLQKIPNAVPDQISSAVVAEIKTQLLKAWNRFSAEERTQVSTTPGLWISLRSMLRFGAPADQAKIRAELGKIAAPMERGGGPASANPSRATGESGTGNYVGELVKHQTMMNIQQMVFSNYMISHGFRSVY